MDPNFDGVWSPSEIDMAWSCIASHNTDNTYTNDTNKHSDNVDEPQPRFAGKEKHQDINMDNMDLFPIYILDDVEATKMAEEPPRKINVVPQKKRQQPVAWTDDEHKNFLRGLEEFGRGSWKSISRYFVPTRTPNQICSHAQKYFQRKECTSRKQRFSINDVGLYDTEPWVQNNSSSLEALAFGHNAYNTNYYDFERQQTVLNNKLAHASEVSRTRGQHIIGSSSIDQTMVQSNSLGREALAFPSGANNTNYFEFDGQQDAMNNLTFPSRANNTKYYEFNGQHDAMNNVVFADQDSNNQVATWTIAQQATTPSIAPMTVQNASPSWEVLSFVGSDYNTNYYDTDGQQVALNNITRGQPW